MQNTQAGADVTQVDLQKQAPGIGRVDGIECWEEADSTTFMVRGQNYMQDKKKVPSEHSMYRQELLCSQQFACSHVLHVIKHMPQRGMAVQFHMFSAALGGYLSNHDTSCSRLVSSNGCPARHILKPFAFLMYSHNC